MEPFSLQINCENILKEFVCSICLTNLEETYITKCGHNFCKSCIYEAINRQHKCPQCQIHLDETDVFKNFTFNSIKNLILEQKEKNFKEYLKNIFKKQYSFEQNPCLLKIEQILKNYLENLLLPYHQKYFESIENYKSKNKIKIQQKIIDKSIINKNLFQIQNFFVESLESELEKYESKILPDNLPKTINAAFPLTKLKLNGITIENNTTKHFLEKIKESAIIFGEPIKEMDLLSLFLVKVDFFHNEEVKYLLNLYNDLEKNDILKKELLNIPEVEAFVVGDKEKINWKTLEHGDTIIIFGEVKFANDYPPECITFNFNKESICDYFSCEDCKIKWICEKCKNYCHRTHKVNIFLSQHKPDWPCCYCFTKGFCKAINKNSIIKK